MTKRRQSPAKLELHPQANPLTEEQAVQHMKSFYGAEFLPEKYQLWLCPAVVDFVVACSRVLHRDQVGRYIGQNTGIFIAVFKLQPGKPRAISDGLQREEKRAAELREAFRLLRKAAKLIGVRQELFYCIEPAEHRQQRVAQLKASAKSQGLSEDDERVLKWIAEMSDSVGGGVPFKEIQQLEGETGEKYRYRAMRERFESVKNYFPTTDGPAPIEGESEEDYEYRFQLSCFNSVDKVVPVMDNPPAIEGETEQEHVARAQLNRLLLTGSTSMQGTYLRNDYLPHVSQGRTNIERSGVHDGKLNAAAARMLWECWPVDLRERHPNVWSPFSLVAEILNWVGYETINGDNVKEAVNSESLNEVESGYKTYSEQSHASLYLK